MIDTRSTSTGRRRLAAAGVAFLLFWMLGAWLGRVELMGPDESRHAEIARELIGSDDRLVPRLHGLPYHDKPIALHAMIAASLAAFGLNETAVRLPVAASGAVAALATGALLARFAGSAAGILAVFVLATTPGFFVLGRYAIADMPFCAALTLAHCAWGGAWIAPDGRHRMLRVLGGYAFLGAAILIKGPAAAAIGAVTLALLFAAGKRLDAAGSSSPSMHPLLGACTAAAVAGPWYVAAWRASPEYIETFLFGHNVARFMNAPPGFGESAAWWYYPAALVALTLPWTPIMFVAAGRLRRPGRDGTTARLGAFLLCWFLSPLLVFVPAAGKSAIYLLPVLPPLAALGALGTTYVLRGGPGAYWRLDGVASATARIWASAAAAATGLAALYLAGPSPGPAASRELALVAAATSAGCLALRGLLGERGPRRALAAIGLVSVLIHAATYRSAVDVIGYYKGMRSLAAAFSSELPSAAKIATFRAPPHAATFYTGRIVPHVDSPDEAKAWLTRPEPTALIARRRHVDKARLHIPHGARRVWESPGGLVMYLNVGRATDTGRARPLL